MANAILNPDFLKSYTVQKYGIQQLKWNLGLLKGKIPLSSSSVPSLK